MFLKKALSFKKLFALCLSLTCLVGSQAFSLSSSYFADYLIFDDNPSAIVQLSASQPDLYFSLPQEDLNRVFDFLFSKSNRPMIREWMVNLYRGSNCLKRAQRDDNCSYLAKLWSDPLLETYFWDASLVQVSRARELLSVNAKPAKARRESCQESKSLLSEVESKEGAMGPVLETQLQVFECLGDESARLEVYQQLEKLRNIKSALGT